MKKSGLSPNEDLKEIRKDIGDIQDRLIGMLNDVRKILVPSLTKVIISGMVTHEKRYHDFKVKK